MKIFNFDQCTHCPERTEFLKQNHNKPLTEEEFVEGWQKLRIYSVAKHKGSRNSPSEARSNYRNLKKNFGFFM